MTNKAILLEPVCLKTLSAVEAHPDVSNEHEFNGVVQLKAIFGMARENGGRPYLK